MFDQEKPTSQQIRDEILLASLKIMEEMDRIREEELALPDWNVQLGATLELDEPLKIDTTFKTPRPWHRMRTSEVIQGCVLTLRGMHELATVDAVVDELRVLAARRPGVFMEGDLPANADEVAKLHDPAAFLMFAETIKVRTALFRRQVRKTPQKERDPQAEDHVRDLNTFCDWSLRLAFENLAPMKDGSCETDRVVALVKNALEYHIYRLSDRDEIVHAMQMKDPVLILVDEISATFTHSNAFVAHKARSRGAAPER